MRPSGCKQKVWLAMGLGLAFLALPAVILLVYSIAVGSGWWLAWLIASAMLGLPSALFTFLGLREEGPVRMDETLERRVLQLAAQHDGELTASKLALGTQLRIDDCQEVLERFEAMNIARSRVGEQGEMRYTFPELRESMEAEDDFMRRLEQEDPRSVLDFDAAEDEEIEEYEEVLHRASRHRDG